MHNTKIPLIEVNTKNISQYGKLLCQPSREPNLARGDIDYYHHIASSNNFTEHAVTSYLISYQREPLLEKIERHRHTEETFIPLIGESVMVLGKPGVLDESELVAVHLDGSFGIQLYRDTWHFAPFALSKKATYLLLSGKDSGPDIEVLDVTARRVAVPQHSEVTA